MIVAFIARIVGPKFAMPVLIGLVALLLIGSGFGVARCSRDTTAERQAEQTNASGEAVANAAANAIAVIGKRAVTENDVDVAVGQIQEEIINAPDPDTIRSAVIAGLCQQDSHRLDPACKLR